MDSYKITLACRNYDRTHAAIRQIVGSQGLDVHIHELTDAADMFTAMFRGEYDVSEFSFGELVYNFSRNPDSFVAIPVFPLRMFRHSWIFVNASAGIKSPEDLRGRKIGLYRLAQTACIWIRGILQEEYGVSAKNTSWFTPSIHNWPDDTERNKIRAPDGSAVSWLERKQGQSNIEALDTALREGIIDAICSAVRPPSFIKRDITIKRLFGNYEDVERTYFDKTKIFPIMHVLAVRKDIVEKHPDLPLRLFELFSQAKKLSNEWIKKEGTVCLAWKDSYLEKERQIFQEDPWAYGLRKNLHVIEKFLSYCYEQGVSVRKTDPRELFASSTWDVEE